MKNMGLDSQLAGPEQALEASSIDRRVAHNMSSMQELFKKIADDPEANLEPAGSSAVWFWVALKWCPGVGKSDEGDDWSYARGGAVATQCKFSGTEACIVSGLQAAVMRRVSWGSYATSTALPKH